MHQTEVPIQNPIKQVYAFMTLIQEVNRNSVCVLGMTKQLFCHAYQKNAIDRLDIFVDSASLTRIRS